jgi:putative CocE/NonD family hydrolase
VAGRFTDFVERAKLMQRGYTFVIVDLRGFGGSAGCLDWGGPGEQADVKAAVKWAATELEGTSGAVGMYGKSYDGVTGLIGLAQRPASRPLRYPLARRHADPHRARLSRLNV